MGANADHDNLQYYTYHDILTPGSVVCVRAVPSVPANDPRGRGGTPEVLASRSLHTAASTLEYVSGGGVGSRGGARQRFTPEVLTWEGKSPTQMLMLQTALVDEDHATVPQMHIGLVTEHTRAVVLVNWASWPEFSQHKSDGVLVALLPGDRRFDSCEPPAGKVTKQEVVLTDQTTGKRFPRLVT
eukprot:2427811-Amphidinium_carterae.1